MATNALRDTTFVFTPLNLSMDQAYALLTDDASGVLFPPPAQAEGVGTSAFTASANPVAHTGAMIALIPSKADLERLAIDGGEVPEELHLTLAYLGEAADIPEAKRLEIMEAAGSYFTDVVHTEAFSVNVFNPHNPAMETAIVLGIKGEDLADPQSNVMSAVRGAFSGMPDNHKPWIPHVTLKYTDDLRKERQEEFLARLGPITFDTLRFAFAGENIDIPLYDADDPDEIVTAAVSRMPGQLRRYWLGPEGSARVGGWGNEGSFRACQREMRKEGVAAREIDGLCANLYRAATGHSPGRKKEMGLDELLTATAISRSELTEVMPETESPAYAAWDGVLTLEGAKSGDGRMFTYGSLSWDILPIPLMYQPANTGGHSGSVMVGQINEVYRKGNQVYGAGIIDTAATYDGFAVGQEVLRQMKENFLTGVSVDVDQVEDGDVERIYAQDASPMDKPKLTVFNRGRIRGATLVAFPAFTEARIRLTGDVLTASLMQDLGVDILDCGCTAPLTAATHTITITDVPPAHWFAKPTDVELKGALTITDEGRVYGLLAPAGVTHRSVKRKVPMKVVDYTRFMKGETLVANSAGETGRVRTGVVTFDCGHADTDPAVYGTLENRRMHYDNSCSVFADIAIGEDPDLGVWVAGAVKPFATGEQIQRAMSCTLSGDWQGHPDRPGVTEFIAALLVPVPGFAMARREASVRLEEGALVASSIPVEFSETRVLELATRKKKMLAERDGLDYASRKLDLENDLGLVGGQ